MKIIRFSIVLILVLAAVTLVSRPVTASPFITPLPVHCLDSGILTVNTSEVSDSLVYPVGSDFLDHSGSCEWVSTFLSASSHLSIYFLDRTMF